MAQLPEAQPSEPSSSDAKKARFQQGLIDMKRSAGVMKYGKPDDPCVAIICKKDDRFKMQGVPGTWRPRQIACYSEYESKPMVNGQVTQISHVCGRTLCVVVAHYTFDPASKNRERWEKCHSKIKKYLKDNNKWIEFQGMQVTIADLPLDLVCPHNPKCFYSVGKIPKD